MRLLQYNLQSLKKFGNKEKLEFFMTSNKIDLAILIETWLLDNSCSSMADYNFISKDRQDGFGGVGIYLRRNIKYTVRYMGDKHDTLAISTINLKFNFNIICNYSPPGLSLDEFNEEMLKIFMLADKWREPTIICGDFNAKARSWNGNVTNQRGVILESLAHDFYFTCLNDGAPTYGTFNSQPSSIDVAFTNIRSCKVSWKSMNCRITNSNHHPIIIELDCESGIRNGRKRLLMKNFLRDIESLSIGEDLSDFMKKVDVLKKKNTIEIPEGNKYIPKYWWDEKAKLLFSKRNWARDKYSRTKSFEDCKSWIKANEIWENYIRERKKLKKNEMINEISNPSSIRQMWKKMSFIKRYQQPKRSNNTWDCKQIREFLCNLTGATNRITRNTTNVQPIVIDEYGSAPPISFQDFNHYLNTRNPDSSQGDDGISYRLLQHLDISSRRGIFGIIEKLWVGCIIPDAWRRIIVCPIPKRGKDPSSLKDSRPICLLSVLLKSLEHLIKIHIERHIYEHKILPSRSYAFRKGRSTTHCVNDVINTVYRLKSRGLVVLGICLDIEKAYDNTDPDLLCNKMVTLRFDPHIVNWLRKFLADRILILRDQEVHTNRGLAQGSTLSPVLFNLFTIELHTIADDKTFVHQFADDFFIISADKSFEEARINLIHKINEFHRRCDTLGLSFNPGKTKAIHFSNRPRDLGLTVNGSPIPEVRNIKYLSRIIAANNSTTEHVRSVANDIKRTCGFFHILNNRRIGIDPNRALQLYRTMIRPKLEYALSSFANMSLKSMNTFQVLANDFLRKGLGLLRSTPTYILYHMAAELPIKYRAIICTAKEILKSIVYGLPITDHLEESQGLNTSISNVYSQYHFIFTDVGTWEEIHNIPDKLQLELDFFRGMANGKKCMNKEIIQSLYAEKVNELTSAGFELIFTDGSVSSNFSGFAFLHHASGFTSSAYTQKIFSSTTTELLAIEMAIEYAEKEEITKVAILTDSKAGIYALKHNNHINYLIRKILWRINNSSIQDIRVIYIPGHSGISGNEAVDNAARNAISQSRMVHIAWPANDALRVIESIIRHWRREYNTLRTTKGVEYGRIFTDIDTEPWT